MAQHPHTKYISKARPILRSSDNIVKSWDIGITAVCDSDLWQYEHEERVNVEHFGKTADSYSKSELLLLAGNQITDQFFDKRYNNAHQDADEVVRAVVQDNDFDFLSMPE